jgi:hypothetical protein
MAAARDAVEAQRELLRVQWVVVALALYCLGVTLGKTQPKCAVDPLPAMPTEAVARALPDLLRLNRYERPADPHSTSQACAFEGTSLRPSQLLDGIRRLSHQRLRRLLCFLSAFLARNGTTVRFVDIGTFALSVMDTLRSREGASLPGDD